MWVNIKWIDSCDYKLINEWNYKNIDPKKPRLEGWVDKNNKLWFLCDIISQVNIRELRISESKTENEKC